VRARLTASSAWRAAPAAIAAVLAGVVLVADPRTVDLAASVYRARLFGQVGFTIWDGNWYSGHYTLGYSVLLAPLAWSLGPLVVGALSTVASAALFEPLARAHFGPTARWGTLWFGVAAAAPLASGRIPFALGVAFGLAALLACQRRHLALATALAVVCSLASPVAGAFLALAGVAYAISGRIRAGALIAAGAIVPILLLAALFPTVGYEPFAFSAFLPVPIFALVCAAVLPHRERALRIGAVLYAVAACATVAIHSPMGGNVARLGTLFAGPVMACVLLGRPRLTRARAVLVAGLLVALAAWQWSPAVRDLRKAYEDPATQASYYRPLLGYLAAADPGRARIEIPFTRSHWEAAEVAPRFPLARGWERQTDIGRNGLFYDGSLDATTYATWLAERGVRFVALADSRPDYSAYRERALIDSGLPYLRLRWESRHWRVYELTRPHPTVVPSGRARISATRLGADYVNLLVRRPGDATVRVTWSPYWRAAGACVQRDGDWTRVAARRAGPLRLTMEFAPDRVVAHGRRCG
jgi:hypothetical protein